MRVLCFSAAFISTLALAAPLERSFIPATAAVSAHFDVEAFAASQVGKAIVENKAAFKLDALDGLSAFGIEPFRDFKGITLFLATPESEQPVVVVHATPAIDGLWNHLKTEPHAKPLNTDGYELLSWEDKGERKYGVVRKGAGDSDRIAFISDAWEPLVEALKVADGKLPSQKPPEAGPDAPAKGSFVYVDVRTLPDSVRKSKDDGAKALFGGVRSGTLDAGESGDSVFAVAGLNLASPQAATDMQEVVQGLAAFGRMALGSQHKFQGVQEALNGMKIKAEESRLNLAVQWPVARAVAAAKELSHEKTSKRREKHKDAKEKDKDGEE